MSNFLTESELENLGLKSYGSNVLIGRYVVLYHPERLSIGHDVRIDDFTIISGTVTLGNYIHISQFCGLYGGDAGIVMEDYSGLSSKGTIYAVSDDYSGASMTNPMVPQKFRPGLTEATVRVGRHALIGCNSVVLPGVQVGEGTAVGSMSLVNKDLEAWKMYFGIPAKARRDRKQDILELEKAHKKECSLKIK